MRRALCMYLPIQRLMFTLVLTAEQLLVIQVVAGFWPKRHGSGKKCGPYRNPPGWTKFSGVFMKHLQLAFRVLQCAWKPQCLGD